MSLSAKKVLMIGAAITGATALALLVGPMIFSGIAFSAVPGFITGLNSVQSFGVVAGGFLTKSLAAKVFDNFAEQVISEVKTIGK